MHNGMLSNMGGGGGGVMGQPRRLMGMAFRGFGDPPIQGAATPPYSPGQAIRGFPGGQLPDPFGFNRQPVTTPPYNPEPMMDVAAPPAADPQRGFFQKNGLGVNILGAIADGVSQGFGGAPNFAIGQQQQEAIRRDQQQFERAQMVRQQERAAEQDQWVQRQIWEREHPAPVKNDTVNDYEFLRQKLGDEAANQYLRNFAAGPVMAVDGFDAAGNPTKTFVPRGSLGGGSGASGPPASAVDHLRKNPGLAARFDEKYGAGASQRYLGGAPSQGGATFR